MRGTPQITVERFTAIVAAHMPMAAGLGVRCDAIGFGTATLALPGGPALNRPGGTMAGPALFGLADIALYAAVLGAIGPIENAVTTSMTINFLTRPSLSTVRAEARLLKLGRRLAVGEVGLFQDGEDPVAHATGTYAIPPGAV